MENYCILRGTCQSDPKQVSNISFKVQLETCQKIAKENGWNIVKVFREPGESAKVADRPKLKEMIEYCRTRKGRVQICLVYKIDRFARNQMDHYAIKARLLEYGVSLRSATEPIDDSPIGKVVEGLFAAVAQLDNDIKSQRVKEAMKNWVLNGRWVWGAKFGYLNKKDATDHAINPHDPDKARYVVEIFKKFSTGLYTYKMIADDLNKRGVRGKKGGVIHPQQIRDMIRDKFYIGIIEMDEHEIKGVFHERLIDDATFYKCQEVADKRAHKNDKKRKTENEDFTLRGPLLCPACGNKLTAAWCQGNTKKYPKYYCIHKGCPLKSKTYKREDVHTGFYNLLLKIQPKDNLTGLFDEIFMRRYKERITELEGDSIRAKNELDTLEAEKMSVIQMLKKGQLLDDEFQTLIQPIRDKIAIARLNFNEVKTDASEIEVCLAYGEKFIQTAALVWFDASPKLKMKIQSMIFPNGLNTTLDVFQTTIYPYLSS